MCLYIIRLINPGSSISALNIISHSPMDYYSKISRVCIFSLRGRERLTVGFFLNGFLSAVFVS